MLTAEAQNATFQWVDCDDNFSALIGETNAVFNATQNGNYAVIVVQNNCTDTTSCYNVTSFNIENNSDGLSFKIFPNPSKGQFNIVVSEKISLTLVSVLGAPLYKEIFESGVYKINMEHLPNGMYFLIVENEKMVLKRNVIILR